MTAAQKLLTYEQYMTEGEINKRYDIIDGVRYFSTPTRRHQRMVGNTLRCLSDYERAFGGGEVLPAPTDVLISRNPLRTRQPDVLFISNEQLARCAEETDPTPLEAAPELVVEILSPSETRRVREDKIRDYCAIGVKECWVVNMDSETVEVLRLSPDGAMSGAVYDKTQTLQSVMFSDLTVAIEDIFAP